MLEDVLAALVEAPLAGIMVNTLDPVATELARRYGARVVTDGARDGHTGAVTAMARILADEGRDGDADGARRHSARHGGGDRRGHRGTAAGAIAHHRSRA